MAYRKGESPEERANRKQVRDSQAREEARIQAESERLRAENAGQPGYDEKGNLQTTDQLPDDIEEPRPDTNLGDFQEQGGYLDPLEASGMPPELGTWDPNKARRDKKINERAQSGQQGADIAKKKQTPQQKVNLPPFMESSGMDESYAREQIGDEADRSLRERYSKDLPDEERIRILIEEGRRIKDRGTPQQQLEWITQITALGGVAMSLVLKSILIPFELQGL